MAGAQAGQHDLRQPPSLSLLERLLNGVLALDDNARARLQAMDGETLTLDVRGVNRQYNLSALDGCCRLSVGLKGETDVTLRGAPFTLCSMAVSDGVQALFSGQVELQGDAEVAKRFKRLFDTLDIDWAEQLAAIIGDYPAHRAMRLLHALGAWRKRSSRVLSEDVGDYLSEEKHLLGGANQIDDLHDAVDELRDDLARLRARVARYEHNQHNA